LRGFFGHPGDLERLRLVLCEVGHILPISFGTWRRERVDGIGIGKGLLCAYREKGQAMNQLSQSWQTRRGQTLWLSVLVEAMERFSAPEWRAIPCDAAELAALRAQLARPAAPYPMFASRFILRN
jgi:hypothetical protein